MAGAPPATNMRMVREIDQKIPRLEHDGWDTAEVADLCSCLAVLRRVRADTEARAAARQKPQVSTSPPHLTFEDPEVVRIFTDRRRDVGLGPASVEPEPWPLGQTEGDRHDSMRAEAGLTSAHLQVIRTADALVRHELGYLGWVSLCDPRYKHGELTALGAAGFPTNGIWRPAV